MSWVDIAIIAILLLSIIISLVRGFTKDAISLTSWILAFVLAITLGDQLATLLPDAISDPRLRLGIAVIVLFIGTLIVGALTNFLFSGVISLTGAKHLDRSLGAIFGAVRGIIIVCALVIGGQLLDLQQTDWWRQSLLLPPFSQFTGYVLPLLPDSVSQVLQK